MPRLLNFRALCACCEAAEAVLWSPSERAALCAACSERAPGASSPSCSSPSPRAHPKSSPSTPSAPAPPSSASSRVPIKSATVVAALCARCALAPAAVFAKEHLTLLCEICARRLARSDIVPLRESRALDGIVFDKMDFSGMFQSKGVLTDGEGGAGANVDLSYYKTKVPKSLVGTAKKRATVKDAAAQKDTRRRRRLLEDAPRTDCYSRSLPGFPTILTRQTTSGRRRKRQTCVDGSGKLPKMETILALEGDGYVLIAADVTSARSIVVMKHDMDRIRAVDDCKLFAAAGVSGDVTKFTEHVQKDVSLYSLRSGITMSTAAVANYTRGELARFLRRAPYQCNVMIAGYDSHPNGDGPVLYSCDYLGTLTKLKFAAEGYAQFFVLSTLDRYWKKNLSLEQGIAVVRKCIAEIQKRLVISQPRFCIKVVSKDGITVIDAADIDVKPPVKGDVDMTTATPPTATSA